MAKSDLLQSLQTKFPRVEDPYSTEFPSLLDISKDCAASEKPIKVCIATEDIVGPIRNGGIGTTYTHLSLLLAEAGHDISIYYLRGSHAEGEDIGYWIKWYKQRGVTFVPIEMNLSLRSPANRWIEPSLRLYQELKNENFDLVHASEWRGSAYFSLLAKKQGTAFNDTLFCIKTSSPWLWNRETCLRTIDESADLVKMYMERRSVELADAVIGGSAYLLRWMLEHGYRLPTNRTFVQPNVVQPVSLPKELTQDRPEYGSRVPVKEVVFFGRLEHRKGLEIFCEAIGSLIKNGYSIPSITFMGKFGARIPSYPKLSVKEFIEQKAQAWGIEWKILNDKNQHEALAYLHGDGVLAVMPSLAENSTLAVYEATHFAIPFIATDVGGTSELVREDHVSNVLTEADPLALARKIEEALGAGGFVAAPEFENENNLQQWRDFHARAPQVISNQGWLKSAPVECLALLPSEIVTSVCLVLKDDQQKLSRTLNSFLSSSTDNIEIIIVDDGSSSLECKDWLNTLEKSKSDCVRIIQTDHRGSEKSRNLAAAEANGRYLLFLEPDAHPTPDAIAPLHKIVANSQPKIIMPFFSEIMEKDYTGQASNQTQVAFISGDPAFTFSEPGWVSPLLYIRKDIFESLGGFTADYKIPGASEEFIANAIINNVAVDALPEHLVIKITDYPIVEDVDKDAFHTRAIRPFLNTVPLKYQSVLINAKAKELKAKNLKSLIKPANNAQNTAKLTEKYEARIDSLRKKFQSEKATMREKVNTASEKRKTERAQFQIKISAINEKYISDKALLREQIDSIRVKHQIEKERLILQLNEARDKIKKKEFAAKKLASEKAQVSKKVRTLKNENAQVSKQVETLTSEKEEAVNQAEALLEEKLIQEHETTIDNETALIEEFLNDETTANSLSKLIDDVGKDSELNSITDYVNAEDREKIQASGGMQIKKSETKPKSERSIDELRGLITNPEQIYLLDLLDSKSWAVTSPLRAIVRIVFRTGPALTVEDVIFTDSPSDLRLKMESSWSWRISRPLRKAGTALKK